MNLTTETGPRVGDRAYPFSLVDHTLRSAQLECLIGSQGLLLGFVDDIWQPSSIRRILYMQRYSCKFHAVGVNVALVVKSPSPTLNSFHMSSPQPMKMPLLADPDGEVHDLYNMSVSGLLIVDADLTIHKKWMMPDERVWPKPQDILDRLESYTVAV